MRIESMIFVTAVLHTRPTNLAMKPQLEERVILLSGSINKVTKGRAGLLSYSMKPQLEELFIFCESINFSF